MEVSPFSPEQSTSPLFSTIPHKLQPTPSQWWGTQRTKSGMGGYQEALPMHPS